MKNLRIILILAFCYVLGLIVASLHKAPDDNPRESENPWAARNAMVDR